MTLGLSPAADVLGRVHDLRVVAARARSRRGLLQAAMPVPSAWSGPAAATFATARLDRACGSLDGLAQLLSALAGLLVGIGDELDPAGLVRRLQTALGVRPDGVWGPASVAAALTCARSHGVPATGEPDLSLLAAIGGGVRDVGSPAALTGLATTVPALRELSARDIPPVMTAGSGTGSGGAGSESGGAGGGTADGGTDSFGPAPSGAPAGDPAGAAGTSDPAGAADANDPAASGDAGADPADGDTTAVGGGGSGAAADGLPPDADPGPDDPEPAGGDP